VYSCLGAHSQISKARISAALVKPVAADGANHVDPGTATRSCRLLWKRLPAPVLATLVRVGVVYVGPEQRGNSLYSVPRARTSRITGVNDFGRELLVDLRSVEIDLPLRLADGGCRVAGKIDRTRRVTLTGIHSFPGACQSGLKAVPSRRRTYNGDDEEERRRRRSLAVVG
jgi:hypothetical protein